MQAPPDYLTEAIASFKRDKVLGETAKSKLWQPFPDSPQEAAYLSQADILGFGGAAGGGKTQLLIGTAFTQHIDSIIFRREYPQLRGIIKAGDEVLAPYGVMFNYNQSVWKNIPGGRTVELAAVQLERDKNKFQGRPHDFIGFDELTHFSRTQFEFLTGWLRTHHAEQRVRVIAAFNPPTDAEGEWVIEYFAPWLDENHPNPALPGELRWFVKIDDKDTEVPNGDPIQHNGETLTPRSRTFIPAKVEDNPIYMATGYKAILQNMPEPLRSKMLYGDFKVKSSDHRWQVIPTAWVQEAQARWEMTPKPDLPMRAMGVDVARGGDDFTVLAPIYGNYVDDLIKLEGHETPDGQAVVNEILRYVQRHARVGVDVIGVGSSVYDQIKGGNLEVHAFSASKASDEKDQNKVFGFYNLRAEAYWKMRELLDPTNGHQVCLPSSRQLRLDLCTPRYTVVNNKIKVEPKEDIIKRIGKSPDDGDAVVIAFWVTRQQGKTRTPVVVKNLYGGRR